MVRYVVAPSNFLVNQSLQALEIQRLNALHLISELRSEKGVLIECSPNGPDHIRLHLFIHALVELVRVHCRHQDNTVHFKVILGVFVIVPYFAVSVFVKPDKSVINCEGSQSRIQLVEA